LKSPPMNQPPAPSETTAKTPPPATFGNGDAAPEVASIGTPEPVAGPTRVNVPPRYNVLPERTMALTCPSVANRLSSMTWAVDDSAADRARSQVKRIQQGIERFLDILRESLSTIGFFYYSRASKILEARAIAILASIHRTLS
jgi:hypothetical protein